MDIDENDSEELRLHIHRLLGEYSRAHYTTDYIEFTENFVAEVQGPGGSTCYIVSSY